MCWKNAFLEKSGPGLFPGITAGQWLSFLKSINFDIDRKFFARAAFVSGVSTLNSVGKRIESLIYSRKINRQKVQSPIFILGSWRSGTTYLQNLLSNDQRFGFPNLYQTLFPTHFLYTESLLGRLIGGLIPSSRPQDNVQLSSLQPSEEEIAISTRDCMSHLVGDIMAPRQRDQFSKFIDLKNLTVQERAQWKESFMFFLKKLTIRHQKPLVLKSPSNTARIKTILELFPDAKFINIHRHPYDVVRSGMSWLKKVRKHWGFQENDHSDVKEIFISNYRRLIRSYLEQRQLVQPSRIVEVAFESLENDPLGELRSIYNSLDLPDFEHAEESFTSYVDANQSYQKNNFSPLEIDLKAEIWEQCKPAFTTWNYRHDSASDRAAA